MTPTEIAWLDAYHGRVRRAVSPLVEPIVRRWLVQATRRVGSSEVEGEAEAAST
jgi:Xaa-Pro aminopeptidase